MVNSEKTTQKKKRIGIVTMYYNSTNYGGLLQAYSLTMYLNNHGYDAKQIVYDFYADGENLTAPPRTKKQKAIIGIKRKVKGTLLKIEGTIHGIGNLQKKRHQICKQFTESIPHTDKVYKLSELKETINDFDIFITGSDQVWNPASFHQGFFLSFVDGNKKKKMSYAASLSNYLPEERASIYKDALRDFDVISVREKSDIEILKRLSDKPVKWVLDPVFLLEKEEWNKQCSFPLRKYKKPYLFCYFLGDSIKQRKLVEEYGKKKKLKVVTIPYMQMTYRTCDKNFGDIRLNDVSPNGFLGLIHEADVVFTDSFHATAFSIIFNKNFIVFNREGHTEMAERIKTVTDLFGCSDRFLEDDYNNIKQIIEVLDDANETEYQSSKFKNVLNESEEILRF